MREADDEEQLEYIRKWYEMKEEEKRKRIVLSTLKKAHLKEAKLLLKGAIKEVAAFLKLTFKKEV